MAVLKGYIKATDFAIVDILQAEFGKEIGEFIKDETAEVLWNADSVKVGYSKQNQRSDNVYDSSYTLGYEVVVKGCDANQILEVARENGDYSSTSKDYYVIQEELSVGINSAYINDNGYFRKLGKKITDVYKESLDYDSNITGAVFSFLVNSVEIKGSTITFEVFAKIKFYQ